MDCRFPFKRIEEDEERNLRYEVLLNLSFSFSCACSCFLLSKLVEIEHGWLLRVVVQDDGGVPRELDRGGGAAMFVVLFTCESDEEEHGGKFC